MLLLLLLFLSVFTACYLLLCEAARLPTIGTTLASLRIAQPKAHNEHFIRLIVLHLSARLAKVIHLDEDRKSSLEAKLRLAGMSLTPETYLAKMIVNFALWICTAVIIAMISRVLGFIVVGYAVYMLFQDLSFLDKAVKSAQEKIESDLPRLASTLAQELQSSRDIIAILTSFLPSTTPALREELQITLADMRSGSPEKALIRMDKRVGSLMLGEIIRGLLMVLQGDDGTVYFRMLEHDFKQAEIQKLSLIAEKRPGKIQVYSFVMFGCLMLTVLGVLILYAYSLTQGLGI